MDLLIQLSLAVLILASRFAVIVRGLLRRPVQYSKQIEGVKAGQMTDRVRVHMWCVLRVSVITDTTLGLTSLPCHVMFINLPCAVTNAENSALKLSNFQRWFSAKMKAQSLCQIMSLLKVSLLLNFVKFAETFSLKKHSWPRSIFYI